ncbi:hypothetical protein ACQY0O_001585 [Thecaphora frezii]
MVADSAPIDLRAFLQPSFDAQALVAQLLARTDSTRLASIGPDFDGNAGGHVPAVPPRQPEAGGASANQLGRTTLSPQHAYGLSALSPQGLQPSGNSTAATLHLDPDDGDLSLAISRLNLVIDEIQSSINAQVEANAPELLKRMSGLSSMVQRLAGLRGGVLLLDREVESLKAKVRNPFDKLKQRQRDFVRTEAAFDLVARASRFVTIANRLEDQMDVLFGGGEAVKADASAGSGMAVKQGAPEVEEDAQDAVLGQVRGRELARAALIIREITSLLEEEPQLSRPPDGASSEARDSGEAERQDPDPGTSSGDFSSEPSLLELDVVKQYLPSIDMARQTVTDYMEDMVVRGLRDLSPIMLSSSLQTAYNLGTLPDLVRDLLADLTEVVKDRIRAAFDMASLGRELGGLKEPMAVAPPAYASYKGRRHGTADASAASAQVAASSQWSAALFRRLETLVVTEMGAVCSKVYTLEKVLRLKTDPDSGVNFLDEALRVLGDRPSLTFWTTLAQSLEAQSREAARRSPFVAQILSASSTGETGTGAGYPGLLRLFHQFFAKVSVYTDIVYTASQQSPETVIALRSLSHLESSYLDASTAKVVDIVQTALSPRRVPTVADGDSVVRAISNLLDAARFDPLLSKSAVKRVEKQIDEAIARVENMAIRDNTAYTLHAHDTTASQALNAGLASFCFRVAQGVSQLSADHLHDATRSTRVASLSTKLESTWQGAIMQPLLTAVRAELATTLARMHQANLGKPMQAAGGDGVAIGGGSGSSVYMTDLSDQVWFLREKVLARYDVGAVKTKRALELSVYTLRLFLVHASLLSPLSEAGKLKLAADMTALEFALEQLLADMPALPVQAGSGAGGARLDVASCGAPWKAVRAFRPFLFLTTSEILKDGDQAHVAQLPAYVVAHHLLGRSQEASHPWFYERKGWTRKQYVEWILDKSRDDDEVARFVLEQLGEGQEEVGEWLRRRLDAGAPQS